MLALHDTHFAEFARLAEPDLGWMGQIPARWVAALPDYTAGPLPKKRMDRKSLKAFCADADNSDEACFVACMAWGGMNREHGREAWKERARWRASVNLLRQGGVQREIAYKIFADLNVAGLGPAYYTKLIFFVRPECDSYILDQWTGKSISLICADQFISIVGAGWVDRGNCANVYSRYCQAVDQIAQILTVTSDVAEEMMFSRGGRKKHAWRSYVVANWVAAAKGRQPRSPAAQSN